MLQIWPPGCVTCIVTLPWIALLELFFSQLDHQTYLLLFIQESVQLVPSLFSHPSARLLEFQLILVKILLLLDGVSTRTQISKVKLISNISVLNI